MDISEIESATRGQINARRNYLMGLWAGRTIGYDERWLPGYVLEVMESDFREPGPHDVVRKIASDFNQHGIMIAAAESLRQLQMAEKGVRAELLATD